MTSKKTDKESLSRDLSTLDSDEGIRIENPYQEKKIFVNKNLFGIYIVLVKHRHLTRKISEDYNFSNHMDHDKKWINIDFIYFNTYSKVMDLINKEFTEFSYELY